MASTGILNFRAYFSRFVGKKVARARLRADYAQAFNAHYPFIRYESDWRKHNIAIGNNESGLIIGPVALALKSFAGLSGLRVLLAGENISALSAYSALLSVSEERIIIAGLDETAHYDWNFERPPPEMGSFDVIVSHAIIEHLIDPYRHVCDLITLLNAGGSLVLYTVMPGFQYHRHPVDCQRFFPDWFVEVAKRRGVKVADMCLSEDHIIVTFRR